MNEAGKKVTSNAPYKKLDDIWSKGCHGDQLKPSEQKRFAAMARSRFHTFQMGMEHADQQRDDEGSLGLIKGLASELLTSPGLRVVWSKLAVSQSPGGELVNLVMEQMEQDTVH